MQAGSTGLGKMTMKMNLVEESEITRFPRTKPPEDSLVLYLKSYEPVVWNVWVSVDEEEIPRLLAQLFKPKLLWFVLRSLLRATFRVFDRKPVPPRLQVTE